MNITAAQRAIPKTISLAACLALLAIFLGYALGGVFGANEAAIKGRLAASGDAVLETVYKGDIAKKDAAVSKSWAYMKRAHLHWGSIGAGALASVAALVLLTRLGLLAQISALFFGAGSVIYGFYWMTAGFMAPGLGGTGAAKDQLEFLGVPGAGLSLLGALGTLIVVALDGFLKQTSKNDNPS